MNVLNKVIGAIFLLMISLSTKGQITNSPRVESQNNNFRITKITLTESNTIVDIYVPKHRGGISFNAATVLVPVDSWDINYARMSNIDISNPPLNGPDPYLNLMVLNKVNELKKEHEKFSSYGWLIRGMGYGASLNQSYRTNTGDQEFRLFFDRLPVGVEKVYIREIIENGKEWYGIHINNPVPSELDLGYNESSIKPIIEKQNDGIVGIYKGLTQDDNQYTLGCIKHNGVYKLIYLDCNSQLSAWNVGNVKAILTPTASPNSFQVNWYMANRSLEKNCFAQFENNSLKIILNGKTEPYIKMFPNNSPTTSFGSQGPIAESEWAGTGFALMNNYIVTNYHVVENAKTIHVQGVNGNFNTKYNASVVATDKVNDLALLKVKDCTIQSAEIPYSINNFTSEVGEDIFVLGYPLTSTMGEEIKLTTGVVSSRTGFQGDVSLYQISAPIQPGNSGGPLFDSQGNVIGIVSAKHKGAENVGYAVKASYLRNLVESAVSTNILPQKNKMSSLTLSGKVKMAKKYVFYITCSNTSNVK